jgi:alpha-tubulin suppressor-like RCC1 family protein
VSSSQDTKPSALCIKQPEQVSNLKVSSIEIGQSLAFAIEHKTKTAYVIGTNQLGELGLSKEDEDSNANIDRESRKTFVE